MKMEQIKCSETSAFNNQTPGKYPKDYTQFSKHGESLKSRKKYMFTCFGISRSLLSEIEGLEFGR